MTTAVATVTREVETRVESIAQTIIQQCNAIGPIDSMEKCEQVSGLAKAAKKAETTIKADIEPVKTLQHAAWKATCDLLNRHLSFTKPVQDKVNEAARFISQERAKAEAERVRIEAEARAKAEAEAQRQRDALIQQAAEQESAGMGRAAARTLAEAEKVEAAPITTIMPDLPEPVKVDGLSARDNWRARCIDLDKVPREYLTFDQKAADAFAKATKGTKQVPGIEFFNDPTGVRR